MAFSHQGQAIQLSVTPYEAAKVKERKGLSLPFLFLFYYRNRFQVLFGCLPLCSSENIGIKCMIIRHIQFPLKILYPC